VAGTAIGLTAAAIGSTVYSLPSGCYPTVYTGITYQYCGGAYYQPSYSGTQVSYTVVEAPEGATESPDSTTTTTTTTEETPQY
jgi:hypothetical protein